MIAGETWIDSLSKGPESGGLNLGVRAIWFDSLVSDRLFDLGIHVLQWNLISSFLFLPSLDTLQNEQIFDMVYFEKLEQAKSWFPCLAQAVLFVFSFILIINWVLLQVNDSSDPKVMHKKAL